MTAPADTDAAATLRPWLAPPPDRATEADIAACFRLLLGRAPNQEEWRGHASRVGEPLELVVASYVNALEFSRRGLQEARPLGDTELTRLEAFAIFTESNDAAVGHHVRHGQYEPDVTAVFRRFLRPGMCVLDIGANIGWFTMLSAHLVGAAGRVVAVEPNPRNARMIEASRRANRFDQVTVCQTAAGRAPGLLVLHRAHSNGTTSAVPDGDAAALLEAETVGCVRAETLLPPGRRLDFLKIDVEGAEYLALQGCEGVLKRDRPVIVTEFSPSAMPGISGIDGPGYLAWLSGLGYRLSIVLPDGSLREAGIPEIMTHHAANGTDHLDLVGQSRRRFRW